MPLGERVYVYRAVGGKAALAEVQAGLRTPDEVEIKAGLTREDVVATGQTRLRDGAATSLSRGYRRPVSRTSWPINSSVSILAMR